MQLYFDIGNTRLKWAIDSSEGLIESGSFDYKAKAINQLELPNDVSIDLVWASSVASSEIRLAIDLWVAEHLKLTVNWAQVLERQAGVLNEYDALSQLGVDRWMAVLGAKKYLGDNGLNNCSAIVVDAGTAVTIDFLSAQPSFRGGAILPGLKMMHRALIGQTAGIESTLMADVVVLGKTTKQCVNSGVHFGYLGAINNVLSEFVSDLGLQGEVKSLLLLTGGDADFIDRSLIGEFKNFDAVHVLPSLVIDGLRCVANTGDIT